MKERQEAIRDPYDADGNVRSKLAAKDSSGTYAQTWTFDWGEASGADTAHALETVMRAVAINASSAAAAWFNYFYDGRRQRLMKVDPLGGETAWFWDSEHRMLEDEGPIDAKTGARAIDEYLWLGGRPVVAFRGAVQAGTELHLADAATADCSRDGDGLACQHFFIVTDNVLRPVVALDSNLAITGTGEYEPFGHPNRVVHFAQPDTSTGTSLQKFPLGYGPTEVAGLRTDLRIHFSVMDAEERWDKRDYVYLGNQYEIPLDGNTYSGYHRGDMWSQWTSVLPYQDVSLWWVSDQDNCAPTGPCDYANYNNNWPYVGFAADAFEYRRVERGAAAYFPPLRAAGQYWDAETDLFENWNRYLEAGTGRYLATEPLLRTSDYPMAVASRGRPLSVYAYASNNPACRTDASGLYDHDHRCANLPSEDLLRSAMQRTVSVVRNRDLFWCIMKQIEAAYLSCDRDAKVGCSKEKGTVAFVDAPLGTCATPKKTVNWCSIPVGTDCAALALIHELAHTCGWDHVAAGQDGSGVPGPTGTLTCE